MPEAQRKLYAVNRRTALDIPGHDGDFPPFQEFQKIVFQSAWFRPEGQLVVADGDEWVGLAAVGYFGDSNSACNMTTGIDRAYRGRELALALKLLAIRVAQDGGAATLRTNNDSENAPILAINRKLGYQPEPGYYKLVRQAPQ